MRYRIEVRAGGNWIDVPGLSGIDADTADAWLDHVGKKPRHPAYRIVEARRGALVRIIDEKDWVA